MKPPLYGLLLAGGRSRRMGRDKAALVYGDGLTQTERGLRLLESCCERTFLSVRADQSAPASTEVLPDRYPDAGPLSGILTAFDHAPDAAWLVVACDLPFLKTDALGPLLAALGNGVPVHAFASRHDGLPEPLCAIYEPEFAPALRARFEAGRLCPRRVLLDENIPLLALPDDATESLDNVNTPEELLAAQERLGVVKTIRLLHFAQLADRRGTPEEVVQTAAATAADLHAELGLDYPLRELRVAVNHAFADTDAPIHDGDTVAFLVPFAGG